MFYRLDNIHHQISIGEVLPLLERFQYYLLDLPFGIQNAVASFQLELEHIVSREAPQSTILYGVVRTNVPSLCAFLEILLGNDPEYDSDDLDCYASPRLCFHIDDKNLVDDAPELMALDQSPSSRMN
jgi:hypothetical protein